MCLHEVIRRTSACSFSCEPVENSMRPSPTKQKPTLISKPSFVRDLGVLASKHSFLSEASLRVQFLCSTYPRNPSAQLQSPLESA